MGTLELAAVGLAGSGVGTALGLPMVWPRSQRSADVRLMGGWLLSASAIGGLISARVMGLLPATTAVEHAINLLGFCTYPLLYLCLRQPSSRTTRAQDAWLWAPASVYIAVLLLRSVLGTNTRVPFVWILPVLLGFTAMCSVAVFRRQDRSGDVVPARWLVAFLVLLNAAQIVRMLFGHVALVPALVPFVMTCNFVTLVGLVLWRALESRPAADVISERPRYEKSGLERDAALTLLAEIERTIAARQIFADPNLTLARLASSVGSTPHQVSEVLNRYAKMTFHELVNRQRVAEVKSQLLDPAADRFTIEGIGLGAGFGSRSALYAAFRRFGGMTPTEFRARARERRTKNAV